MEADNRLKWYFADALNIGGRGVNDGLSDLFKGDRFMNLVRESIQNSIDAHDKTNDDPVLVSYRLRRLNKSELDGFDTLIPHIKKCAEENASLPKFKNMLACMDEDAILYLDVSDSNTVGMDYDRSIDRGRFRKFVRYSGDPNADEGAGGSHGYGKITYFNVSRIGVIIVSSMSEGGVCTFEGASRLATHEKEGELGRQYLDMGFYDRGDGWPIQEAPTYNDASNEYEYDSDSLIPVRFRRQERGTTVSILDVDINEANKRGIFDMCCQTVLRSFFGSIWSEKLVVEIDFGDDLKFEVSKATIADAFTNRFFREDSDYARQTPIYRFNPHPYWVAYSQSEVVIDLDQIERDQAEALCSNAERVRFDTKLENLGQVSFYAYKNRHCVDNIVFMRSPRMIVNLHRGSRTPKGFAGVFLCNNDAGNLKLRLMEDAAHVTWSTGQLVVDRRPQEAIDTAWKIETEMQELIERCTKILFPPSATSSEEVIIEGFELPIFDAKTITESVSGGMCNLQGSNSEVQGAPTGNILEGDARSVQKTGALTTITNTIQTKVVEDAEGDLTGGSVHSGGGGGEHPGEEGNDTFTQTADGEERRVREHLRISKPRVMCELNSQGVYVYTVILSSPKNAECANLKISAVGDSADSEGVAVNSADFGGVSADVKGNEIRKLKLQKGKNKLTFTVTDNMPYAIRIIAENEVILKA